MVKPMPSLDGLIQPKGAPRPDSVPQRGGAVSHEAQAPIQPEPLAQAPEPSLAPAAIRPAAPATRPAAPEPKAKALTLRLTLAQYEKLRRYAFEQNLTHQDVLEDALMAHLPQ